MNTEQASSNLDNLRAKRAATATELAATEARIRELTEAMGRAAEVDPQEWLRLPVDATGAREQIKALDAGIKAASEALTASQWGDKLAAAREHKAARPDTEGEVRKLAAGIHKKLAAIEAKAAAWNDAGRIVSAGAKGSLMRELTTRDQWGGAAIIDGVELTDARTRDMNKWISEALDAIDREEFEERKAAALAAAGPDPYTSAQRLDAADAHMDVAEFVEQQRREAVRIERQFDDALAAKTSGPRPGVRGGRIVEAAAPRRNF